MAAKFEKVKHKIDIGVVVRVILMAIVFSMFVAVTVAVTVAVIEDSKNDTIKNRLEVIEGGCRQSVSYDCDTKVMYLWDYRGGYTVMVDADGKPLLYE